MALVTVQRSPNSVGESPSTAECKSDGEAEDDEPGSRHEKSECFFAGKGTALVLALKDIPQHHAERRLSTDSNRSTNSTQSNNSDIQQHLQSMFNLLRHEETLKMAVKLESQRPNRTRYLVIASRSCFRAATERSSDRRTKIARHNSAKAPTPAVSVPPASSAMAVRQASMDSNMLRTQQSQNSSANSWQESSTIPSANEMHEKRVSATVIVSNRQSLKCDADKNAASAAGGDSKCANNGGIDESCLLGIDCNEHTTIGLVVPILADTTIHLDGDGGFSVSVYGKTHIFKPVSVQAMWSALQTLHKVSHKARENNFYPGGPSHDWLTHYESRIESEQSCLNEWNAMDSLESRRPPSPDAIRNKPTAKEETESVIKMKLKEIMMSVDLDEVTSKYIRGRLEEHLDMDLGEYKSFIDEEMLIILGQMDAPTEIFEHVYLGSEWNASNLEELQKNGVRHILNVTREIDNFFPGIFDYCNVRVYDDEKTNLLKHWDNTYRYITHAKAEGSKVLVHCKMGVSRSASVVIAYAMKAYNWEFQQALQHVKERRNCIKPNKNFLNQLETYRGMLDAMKNKEKLQRSKSETNLKSTKDARLLPGSEPTPLIQALNQSTKSKSAGHGVSGDGISSSAEGMEMARAMNCLDGMSLGGNGSGSGGELKQRRVVRRSSSTSPKSIHGHTAIVMKQQSQSLENLTPERSVADEPKNVRFPGSNGENYSVTQNQVLHIQKNTPPPPPPPLPPASLLLGATPSTVTSVRNIVHDLEAHRDVRKTVDDRKTLNLQFGRSVSHETTNAGNGTVIADAAALSDDPEQPLTRDGSVRSLGSPVWTSSAKLITQTSHLLTGDLDGVTVGSLRRSLRTRRNTANSSVSSSCDAGDMFSAQLDNVFAKEEEEKRHHQPHHSRKSQSWAATGGGIVMDAKLGSNSSIDSASSSVTAASALLTTPYEGVVRPQPRLRELPSRHASWGSGDNRSVPQRKGSWGAYDSNRNTYQYAHGASAIVEGQIHELNMSNKTVTNTSFTDQPNHLHQHHHNQQPHHVGTVKRTKQKLEECTALKKLCQENGEEFEGEATESSVATAKDGCNSLSPHQPAKRSTNLYRSASAAGAIRARYPHRCYSEDATACGVLLLQRTAARRSDGSKPFNVHDLLPFGNADAATVAYTTSDIENKNTLPLGTDGLDNDNDVMLRAAQEAAASAEDQRISGNVQILKKSFEAKAGAGPSISVATVLGTAPSGTMSVMGGRKGHHSLPSSPVAQHAQHIEHATDAASAVAGESATSTEYIEQSVKTVGVPASNVSLSASPSSSSASEVGGDRNVKVLVHKYQTTSSSSTTNTASASNLSACSKATTTTSTSVASHVKPRPRSYYETTRMHKSLVSGKPHDYSDSRPPPAPAKSVIANVPVSQLSQQYPAPPRRLQQHGKTHPLARLPKQSFNAAAYNTM